ncbi:MAG TPA: Hsp70 family protein [Vicinamibacterales bacterium]|nr:Hsp70 family protein [Vicinamibacterales bacterium]
MSATPTDSRGRRFVGIDLGTTNCALAWTGVRGPVRVFDIPQQVAPGEMAAEPVLPSFLYLPTAEEVAAGIVAPAAPAPAVRDTSSAPHAVIVGMFAREQGALVPTRLVSSAKSWLSNPSVDRRAAMLPWGAEGARLSPVTASAYLLAHLRETWNREHAARDRNAALERQEVVVTVPASFDQEARELTVQAARQAGLDPRLLEEPLAALYAWIGTHRRDIASHLFDGALVLVCDVGGGTTDFSLIRARSEKGAIEFERVAIGEHLLLGGDNLDLALSVIVERKMTGGDGRLTLGQRQILRRKCSAAKEALLSEPAPADIPITVLGSGRGVVAGGLTTTLTREEVMRTLEEGYLPSTRLDDLPARDRRVGLRELGLPYESDPAITRHLAGFLTRSARALGADAPVCPDAVLFNGGFFTPAPARARVLAAMAAWFGRRPDELHNDRPEAAVAIGAALYGRFRSDPAAYASLLIRAGSARSYYVGVRTAEGAGRVTALCVLPRGTQEGSSFELDRQFAVNTNSPAAFTLYSTAERADQPGDLVSVAEDDVHRHAPLVTILRFGRRSRRVPLEIRLHSVFTETGTLELWCASTTTEHRWRLSFNLRPTESEALGDAGEGAEAGPAADQVLIAGEALARAGELIRHVFAPGGTAAPEALVGEMEAALGHGKHAWPLAAVRRLADVLLEHGEGRRRSPAHEARWLNMTGFCARPGFGSPLDEWRVSELRKIYAAGLTFPREVQGQVEWLVLWQRVAPGFSAGQQRELAQRVMGQLGFGQVRPARLNPQIERESWRLLGSLERLDAAQRTRLGDALLDRVRRDPRNASWAWAIGRAGARRPLYGPLNAVVSPAVATRWVEALLALKAIGPEVALAIVQIAAQTDDPARDVANALSARAAAVLREQGVAEDLLVPLESATPPDRAESVRIFGESLPEGLQLTEPGNP